MSQHDEDLGQWEDEQARQRALDDVVPSKRAAPRFDHAYEAGAYAVCRRCGLSAEEHRGEKQPERARESEERDELGRLLTVARGYVERRERTMPVEPALVVEVIERVQRLTAQRDRMHAQRAKLREEAVRDEDRWLSPFIVSFPENLILWREYCAMMARER